MKTIKQDGYTIHIPEYKLKSMKYSCQKIEDHKFYVWHTEGDTKTQIAITDTYEKAHSIAYHLNNDAEKAQMQLQDCYNKIETLTGYLDMWRNGKLPPYYLKELINESYAFLDKQKSFV
jgi:hypothetical protein